jgi:hypothetical protein
LKKTTTTTEKVGNTEIHADFPLIFSDKGIDLGVQMQSGEKCYQDSVVPTEDLSVQLYDSIEDCCAYGLSWMSDAACLSASGISVTGLGSTSFYIQDEKCAQDCEGAAPCGGFANTWDFKFDTCQTSMGR